MIRIIKLGNLIYENIEPFTIDEQGNQVWNIPQDFASLQAAVLDTLAWVTGQKIFQATQQDITKRHAAISKSIVLLAKVISTLISNNGLTFDPTTQLSVNEQAIWNNLNTLASNGYCDSELTNNAVQSIVDHLTWYNNEVATVQAMTTVDELITYLENLTL